MATREDGYAVGLVSPVGIFIVGILGDHLATYLASSDLITWDEAVRICIILPEAVVAIAAGAFLRNRKELIVAGLIAALANHLSVIWMMTVHSDWSLYDAANLSGFVIALLVAPLFWITMGFGMWIRILRSRWLAPASDPVVEICSEDPDKQKPGSH